MNGPVALDHSPIRPPRDGFIGEAVFAELWKARMDLARDWISPVDRGALGEILDHLEQPVTQRDASVAASFISWLGTNVGSSFLDQTDALSCLVRHDAPSAYVAEWAAKNRRLRHVNLGWRSIELFMMTKEQSDRVNREGTRPGPGEAVDITVRDLEVAEQIAAWLGTTDGRQFCRDAHDEITRREAAAWRNYQAATNAMRSPEVGR